ncbi:low affinity potassium transporter [Tulasnella sp. 418]|nr:low affinity potassium transporter [Tulasnella sp. 418]
MQARKSTLAVPPIGCPRSTANLRAHSLTGFQQAILYYLMATGNYTITSFVMVVVRKHYFIAEVLKHPQSGTYFRRFASTAQAIRSKTVDAISQLPERIPRVTSIQPNNAGSSPSQPPVVKEGTMQQLHPLVKVESAPEPRGRTLPGAERSKSETDDVVQEKGIDMSQPKNGLVPADHTPVTESPNPDNPSSPPALGLLGEPLYRTESPSVMTEGPTSPIGRAPTFGSSIRRRVPGPSPLRHGTIFAGSEVAPAVYATPAPGPRRQGTGLFFQQNSNGVPLTHSLTVPASHEAPFEKGFGGFSPTSLASKLAKRVAPNALHKLETKLTLADGVAYVPSHHHHQRNPQGHGDIENSAPTPEVPNGRAVSGERSVGSPGLQGNPAISRPSAVSFHPMTNSESQPLPLIPSVSSDASSETDWADEIEEGAKIMWKKSVSYIKEGVLWVGRNSAFRIDDLNEDQIEELGGVEYRALRILSWILALYFIGTQLVTFTIITVYLSSTSKYDSVFDNQPRYVPKAWFAAFQCMSAYTGGGLTLVDQGMVPFRPAFLIVITQGMLIVAGNMGFPILLRLVVWLLSKMVTAEHRAPLQFLLDHPRRCFLYLFPSHQTWFLVVVFLVLSCIEWFSFLLLDIGLDSVECQMCLLLVL